jgi:hypothetical protein
VPVDGNAQALRSSLNDHGLSLRGHWLPTPADALPALPDGSRPGVVWLVGVIGSGFWPHFKASPFYSDGRPDPLDRWSRAIGDALATQWGGTALYPFDGPPYHPFQRWADRAEATQASAMLLRIHPDYGLWHAYRFALALPLACAPTRPLDSRPLPPSTSLCAHCTGQPCLQACPVQAYTGATFKLHACAQHLQGDPGQPCMQGGCLARLACPVAPALRYTPEHAAFHMQAFAAQHRPAAGF